MSRRAAATVIPFPLVETRLAAARRERATRPRLPIFCYRVEQAGERTRHELLCQICAGTFDEPARVVRGERAYHARGCDRCGSPNEAAAPAAKRGER